MLAAACSGGKLPVGWEKRSNCPAMRVGKGCERRGGSHRPGASLEATLVGGGEDEGVRGSQRVGLGCGEGGYEVADWRWRFWSCAWILVELAERGQMKNYDEG